MPVAPGRPIAVAEAWRDLRKTRPDPCTFCLSQCTSECRLSLTKFTCVFRKSKIYNTPSVLKCTCKE